jgi:hypothetical protein
VAGDIALGKKQWTFQNTCSFRFYRNGQTSEWKYETGGIVLRLFFVSTLRLS